MPPTSLSSATCNARSNKTNRIVQKQFSKIQFDKKINLKIFSRLNMNLIVKLISRCDRKFSLQEEIACVSNQMQSLELN